MKFKHILVLAITIPLIAAYLMIAFVMNDLQPSEWAITARIIMLVLFGLGFSTTLFFLYETKSINRHGVAATRKDWADKKEVVNAFIDGRDIQVLAKGVWYDSPETLRFHLPASHYRIKEPAQCMKHSSNPND